VAVATADFLKLHAMPRLSTRYFTCAFMRRSHQTRSASIGSLIPPQISVVAMRAPVFGNLLHLASTRCTVG